MVIKSKDVLLGDLFCQQKVQINFFENYVHFIKDWYGSDVQTQVYQSKSLIVCPLWWRTRLQIYSHPLATGELQESISGHRNIWTKHIASLLVSTFYSGGKQVCTSFLESWWRQWQPLKTLNFYFYHHGW